MFSCFRTYVSVLISYGDIRFNNVLIPANTQFIGLSIAFDKAVLSHTRFIVHVRTLTFSSIACWT